MFPLQEERGTYSNRLCVTVKRYFSNDLPLHVMLFSGPSYSWIRISWRDRWRTGSGLGSAGATGGVVDGVFGFDVGEQGQTVAGAQGEAIIRIDGYRAVSQIGSDTVVQRGIAVAGGGIPLRY